MFNNEGDPDVDFPYALNADGDCSSLAQSSTLTDTAKFGEDTKNADKTPKKRNNNNDDDDDDFDDGSLADSSVLSSSVSPTLRRYLASSSSLSSLPTLSKRQSRFTKVAIALNFSINSFPMVIIIFSYDILISIRTKVSMNFLCRAQIFLPLCLLVPST